jgi:hypothetical protein
VGAILLESTPIEEAVSVMIKPRTCTSSTIVQSKECESRTMVSEIALFRVGYGYLKTCLGGFDRVGDWVGKEVDVRFAMRDSSVVVGDKSFGESEEG